MTNVHRHAESPCADIRLSVDSGRIYLEVQDRGRGIPSHVLENDSQSLASMGVGMRGMTERLRQLAGRLVVKSGDWGTLVRAEVPLERAPMEET